MALTNSLLYELSANSLEQNIELVELVLRSPVHIPQKREIVISWLCKCIEDHDSVPHSETATLWKLLHMLLEDMEPREVVIVAQDSFLKAMTNMLRGLENMDRQRHILLAASLLLQKAPQSILSLKLLSLEQMLAVALDRACMFVRNGQDCSDLCPTLSALMNVVITSWQQAPCTLEEAISRMKPLLSHMMLFLHLEKKNASEGLSNVCSQIKRMINVMFFHRDKMSVWLACLSTYLKEEETEMQDKASCLQLLSAFFGQVCETQICANTEPPVETFLPEFFATFLEGFMAHNKTEDIQSNVVLLAYFAHLLGMQCEEAFGKSVFQGLSFTPELQLYHVNRLLQVYEQSKQYHLMVALPQLKKSLFKPRKWFGELVPGLQAMEHTSVSWFTCLNTAMNIAPNLVEGSMIKTLQKCWTVPSLVPQLTQVLSIDYRLAGTVAISTLLDAPFASAKQIVHAYFGDDSVEHDETSLNSILEDIFGDVVVDCPTILFGELAAELGIKAYRYIFAHRPSYSIWPKSFGPTHNDDLAFTLGYLPFINDTSRFTPPLGEGVRKILKGIRYTQDELDFMKELIGTWTSFIETGKPSIPSSTTEWPRYSASNPECIYLRPHNYTRALTPRRDICELWRPLLLRESSQQNEE
ncbi:uncharacterized protein ISCGN_005021 [Ixodes scapularis]